MSTASSRPPSLITRTRTDPRPVSNASERRDQRLDWSMTGSVGLTSPFDMISYCNRSQRRRTYGFSHGNNVAILHVQNSVLLEDWSQHSLDDNAWAWGRDERRLLMQLLGEEINTQVAVLASGSGGGDANDLARTALKDQEIAHADVVTWNRHSVDWCRSYSISLVWASSYFNVNFTATERMLDLLSDTVKTVTE